MPQELQDILLLSLLNPATLLTGYWLGRRADQSQKLVLAAFIAGIAGALFAWLLMRFGYTTSQPKLVAGIFLTSAMLGLAWSWLGYKMQQFKKSGE